MSRRFRLLTASTTRLGQSRRRTGERTRQRERRTCEIQFNTYVFNRNHHEKSSHLIVLIEGVAATIEINLPDARAAAAARTARGGVFQHADQRLFAHLVHATGLRGAKDTLLERASLFGLHDGYSAHCVEAGKASVAKRSVSPRSIISRARDGRRRRGSRRSRDDYARLSRAAGSKTLASAAPRRSSFSRCLSLASSCSSAFTTPSSGMSNYARRNDRRIAPSSSSSSSVSRRRASRHRARHRRRASGSKVNSTPTSPLARRSRIARASRASLAIERAPVALACSRRHARVSLDRSRAHEDEAAPTTAVPHSQTRAIMSREGCVARRVRPRCDRARLFHRRRRVRARVASPRACRKATGRWGNDFTMNSRRARRCAPCLERCPTDDDVTRTGRTRTRRCRSFACHRARWFEGRSATAMPWRASRRATTRETSSAEGVCG
jgi:hypothetical protein